MNSSLQSSSATSSSRMQPTQASNPTPSSTTTVVSPAAPSRTTFDPWNSSSTGHQRAENRLGGSTSWRESRSLKLSAQYRGWLSGGSKRVADTVGQGSEDFGKDGRTANGGWVNGAKGLRTGAQRSLMEVWGASKGSTKEEEEKKGKLMKKGREERDEDERPSDQEDDPDFDISPSQDEEMRNAEFLVEECAEQPKPIFESLSFYINGSTGPSISDYKLKQLIASHGGSLPISMAKRRITHVILGTSQCHGRCGGGLAASKVQREIATMRGKGVKFVSVEWVLEWVKRGKRVPEAGYSMGVKIAGQGQGSVYGMFGKRV